MTKFNGIVPVTNNTKAVVSSTPEENKHSKSVSIREDRVASLKVYRRAKGLCFTCGERC